MLEVDKKTFEEEVLQAEGYVLVDFYGDGCVPCQALMPHVHALADEYGVDDISSFYKQACKIYKDNPYYDEEIADIQSQNLFNGILHK